MARVFITGVRGKTGAALAAWLGANRRVQVRGGTSRPQLGAPAGVEPAAFDWAEPAGWAAALEDVDAVYLMRPDVEDAPERVARLVAAAPAGARIVLLSEMGADQFGPDTWMAAAERAVTSADRPWTILRPSWFQQVFTDDRYFRPAIVERGVIEMPTAGAGFSWIDARDIAAVAGHALTDDGHAGVVHTLSGPAAVPLEEVARELSAATARPIRAVDVAPGDATAGLEPWLAEMVGHVYERGCAGGFGEVTDDVRAVTGRAARSIESFVAEHAAVWTPVVA